MCSISGFIANEPIERERARRLGTALLYYGAARGSQSAGAYVNGRLAKMARSPGSFIESSEFFNLFDKEPTHALFHTRFPTSGGHGDNQAQPFMVGDTVSVHNGMFYNTGELKRQWNIQKASGVDSELLTSFVDSYGPNKLPEYIKSTCGVTAAAVLHKDKMFMIRDGNPIHYMTFRIVNGPKLTVFASTDDILMHSLRHAWLIPDTYVSSTPDDGILYSVDHDGLTALSKKPATGKDWITGTRGWPSDGHVSYTPTRSTSSLPEVRKRIVEGVKEYDEQMINEIIADLNKEGKLTKRERKSYRRELKEALRGCKIPETNPPYGSEDSHSECGG